MIDTVARVADMTVAQLRAFLAGDDDLLSPHDRHWQRGVVELFGPLLRRRRHSSVTGGRLVIWSRARGRVAEFPLDTVESVVCLAVPRLLPDGAGTPVHVWVVGTGGVPVAEIPWHAAAHREAAEAGLRVRSPCLPVDGEAFTMLRPAVRLR